VRPSGSIQATFSGKGANNVDKTLVIEIMIDFVTDKSAFDVANFPSCPIIEEGAKGSQTEFNP